MPKLVEMKRWHEDQNKVESECRVKTNLQLNTHRSMSQRYWIWVWLSNKLNHFIHNVITQTFCTIPIDFNESPFRFGKWWRCIWFSESIYENKMQLIFLFNQNVVFTSHMNLVKFKSTTGASSQFFCT